MPWPDRLSPKAKKKLRYFLAVDRTAEAGAGAAWLGWKAVDEAIRKFLEATAAANEALDDFSFAVAIRAWLAKEAPSQVAEYAEWLTTCEDDLMSATKVVRDLREEGESVEELLAFLDQVEVRLQQSIGDEASDKLRAELVGFVLRRLEPVRVSGWHMHSVFIGAA